MHLERLALRLVDGANPLENLSTVVRQEGKQAILVLDKGRLAAGSGGVRSNERRGLQSQGLFRDEAWQFVEVDPAMRAYMTG